MEDKKAVARNSGNRDHTQIDEADPVDVASFDSFPASDAPAWIASGIERLRAHHAATARLAQPHVNA